MIKFAKVRPSAVIPSKREEDAGYDIYACFVRDEVTILPHETLLIPTGIASAFSDNYVMILKERGSTGTKGLGQRSGVIDSGFRGEWLVPITNHNTMPLKISKKCSSAFLDKENNILYYPYNKAIAQALLLPVPKEQTKEISYDELKEITSERGVGKLGSSNK